MSSQLALSQTIESFEALPEVHKKLLVTELGQKKMQILTLDSFAYDSHALGVEEIGEDTYYYETQIISRNDQIGDELIKKSNVKKNPVEYLTVSASYQGKEYHFGDFYTSKTLNGISLDKIDVAYEIFISKFNKRTGTTKPDYITFAHSHPVYEAITTDKKKMTRKSLSTQDLILGKNISRLLRIPVIVKAVLPNGYSYSAIFQNGINTSTNN